MHVAGVAIMILVVVAVVLAIAYGLLKTYIDKRESNAIMSFVSTMAVAVTLLCVMLIPIDICEWKQRPIHWTWLCWVA